MGARNFVELHLTPLLRPWGELTSIARPASASPAAGSHTRHRLEQDGLVSQAIGAPPRAAVA